MSPPLLSLLSLPHLLTSLCISFSFRYLLPLNRKESIWSAKEHTRISQITSWTFVVVVIVDVDIALVAFAFADVPAAAAAADVDYGDDAAVTTATALRTSGRI